VFRPFRAFRAPGRLADAKINLLCGRPTSPRYP
jgi:hypothetical protein